MVKITADSTCDLSPEILESLDITIAPLYINAGERSFRDGVDIMPADVFRYLEEQNIMCTTAACNIFDYETLFGTYASRYDAVVHINLGTGFSVCHQNALAAAEPLPNVYVVDSRNLSTGSGILVYEAGLMAKNGLDAPEICARLNSIVPLVDCSFVIDRLDYLYKGGRCSGMEAIGARLLNIKPCIEVREGEMQVGKKYRGQFEKCLLQYVADRLSKPHDLDTKRIFITHPMCPPQTLEAVRAAIAQYAQFEQIIETRAGCTISSHCGPSTLGIIFKRK